MFNEIYNALRFNQVIIVNTGSNIKELKTGVVALYTALPEIPIAQNWVDDNRGLADTISGLFTLGAIGGSVLKKGVSGFGDLFSAIGSGATGHPDKAMESLIKALADVFTPSAPPPRFATIAPDIWMGAQKQHFSFDMLFIKQDFSPLGPDEIANILALYALCMPQGFADGTTVKGDLVSFKDTLLPKRTIVGDWGQSFFDATGKVIGDSEVGKQIDNVINILSASTLTGPVGYQATGGGVPNMRAIANGDNPDMTSIYFKQNGKYVCSFLKNILIDGITMQRPDQQYTSDSDGPSYRWIRLSIAAHTAVPIMGPNAKHKNNMTSLLFPDRADSEGNSNKNVQTIQAFESPVTGTQ